ncbi:DUF362 domain-containing protein [Candidatus Thorarchaeota archaeon]|nr:MAG: DUF362 domain-containing protein [Candidatus Thorarchaeota archaeon]
MSLVSVVKGERGIEPVFRAMGLIPFEEALATYDTVLVKPNLMTSHTFETGITTDPIVMEAVIKKVMELGKKAIVVETEGIPTATEDVDRVGHFSAGVHILQPMTESWSLTQHR